MSTHTERPQTLVRKAVEVNVEGDTRAVRIGRTSNIAADISGVAIGQDSLISHADGVVGRDLCIAKFAGCAWDRLRGLHRDEGEGTQESSE